MRFRKGFSVMSANGLALRPSRRRSISSGPLFRAGLAALFILTLTAAADAYTLVLRSGRLVTVPEDFKVTPSAVTYEVSPGCWVTVWLSNVDFAATERANAESAGSFARKIMKEPEGTRVTPASAPGGLGQGRRDGRKVVTNEDLEPSRLRRQAQEQDYERTRRERGMPSKQELRRSVEERDRMLHELARQIREERVQAEMESLRAELAKAKRDLHEQSLRLSQQAAIYAPVYDHFPYFYTPPIQVIPVFKFGHRRGFGRGNFGHHPHGRSFPYRHARPGHPFPSTVSPSRNAGGRPRVPAPAVAAPRRGR